MLNQVFLPARLYTPYSYRTYSRVGPVVIYAGFGAKYAVSVCVNGLQWVSSTPNFRTLRAEVAAKVTLTHEKEGSDGTRRHY